MELALASSMQLLELRFENNRFVGTIPDFPPSLVMFNASNNQLQGRIPPSLCDITDTSSFSGNKNLCGRPLETKCDEIVPKTNENMAILHLIIVIISCLLAIATLIMVYLQLDMKNDGEKDGVIAATTTPKGDGKLTFFRDDYGCFDLQDLLRASAEVLGSGNFGSCYKAALIDGHSVVVKRYVHMTNCGKHEFHHHMRTLGNLSHPNLLPLIAYYYRPQEKLLVFNFVHNGSLSKQLHGTSERKAGRGLNWPTRLTIIKGVAEGMVYLYKKLPNLLVAHGNLKSSNVLLDKWMQPLLMDYALLPVVNVEQAHNLMAAFKAPAFLKQGRIDKNLDVWSLGILILWTMTGKLPSTHGSELERWVETIEREKVFDKEMGGTENAEAQMKMLLQIGIKCCKDDDDDEVRLTEVANKIQQLEEKDI